MYHPVIEVTYLLDPKFVSCNLEEDGMSIISNFLEQYYLDDAEKIYTQILQYKSQTGLFQNQLVWKT
ncbi:5295_t:CDS:1, partial [Scutellospora calospora]